MGYLPGDPIQQAGDYLLSILRAEPSVRYSRFYDGRDETHEALCQAIGLENEWYSPEVLMDEAVDQLHSAGFVTIEFLQERLADEEPDYTITLTTLGKSFIRYRRAFRFHDVDL